MNDIINRKGRGSVLRRADYGLTGLRAALTLCWTLLWAVLLPSCPTAAAAPPNLVFILADDLGRGDLGCYGQTRIKTPNLDRLAAEGLKFMQHYSGSCVCAPSRCTLLTGRHTGQAHVRANKESGSGYASAEGQLPIPAGTVTVAKLLQARGYATAAVGKWGLGGPESTGHPNQQGFDHFFGYLCQRKAHTHYPDYLWRNADKVMLAGNQTAVESNRLVQVSARQYAQDLLTAEALGFVRKNSGRPFFLYLPYTAPHLALQVPDDSLAEYAGKFPETPYDGQQGYLAHSTPRAAYAAMVSRLDRDIGRLMTLLKELSLDENTVVMFSSDNGPITLAGTDAQFFNSAEKFRGQKMDLYEGGIRAPLLARWPGKIKPGSTTEHVSAFWDVLPTLVEIAGGKPPAGLDGISFLPTLLGRGEQRRHEFLYWEYHERGGSQAVRLGDWKAVRQKIMARADGPIELYDLAGDAGEQENIAAAHPDVVAKVAGLFVSARTPSKEFPTPLDSLKP